LNKIKRNTKIQKIPPNITPNKRYKIIIGKIKTEMIFRKNDIHKTDIQKYDIQKNAIEKNTIQKSLTKEQFIEKYYI